MSDPVFAIIPDVHLNQTSSGQPATWIAQAAWIVANRAAYNIQGVFSVGDFTAADADSSNFALGWTDGMASIDALGIPWGCAVGNHDTDAGETNGDASRVFTTWAPQLGHGQ